MKEKPLKGTIERWTIDKKNGVAIVVGEIYGHPDASNGNFIKTSKLVRMDFEKMEAETLNSRYKLGEQVSILDQYR